MNSSQIAKLLSDLYIEIENESIVNENIINSIEKNIANINSLHPSIIFSCKYSVSQDNLKEELSDLEDNLSSLRESIKMLGKPSEVFGKISTHKQAILSIQQQLGGQSGDSVNGLYNRLNKVEANYNDFLFDSNSPNTINLAHSLIEFYNSQGLILDLILLIKSSLLVETELPESGV
ncbi:MAG TPA: hypothetical protein V6D15_08520 [Oculatellaceae cyanobacterium]|jgi:hypothetical protein